MILFFFFIILQQLQQDGIFPLRRFKVGADACIITHLLPPIHHPYTLHSPSPPSIHSLFTTKFSHSKIYPRNSLNTQKTTLPPHSNNKPTPPSRLQSWVYVIIATQRLQGSKKSQASLQTVEDNPYSHRDFRKAIDSAAFKIYGHWVQKRGQNRAVLFQNEVMLS